MEAALCFFVKCLYFPFVTEGGSKCLANISGDHAQRVAVVFGEADEGKAMGCKCNICINFKPTHIRPDESSHYNMQYA